MLSLSTDQEAIIKDVVQRIGRLENVTAIVLGGSYARGRARPDSDIDVGIYYRDEAPFSIDGLQKAAHELSDCGDPVVAGFGEWGPWANGGAWLTVQGQRVDLLYRSLEQCDSVIEEANQGKYEIHYEQQPPFGFFGPTYLGEVHVAVPLLDELGEVSRMKHEVKEYPESLRRSVVQSCLWGVEFGLEAFAPKFAKNSDVYNVAGCLARFSYYLVLTLFALNRTYLVNDKTALDEIREFDIAPDDFGARVTTMLTSVGNTPELLAEPLSGMRTLHQETAALANGLYRSNRTP